MIVNKIRTKEIYFEDIIIFINKIKGYNFTTQGDLKSLYEYLISILCSVHTSSEINKVCIVVKKMQNYMGITDYAHLKTISLSHQNWESALINLLSPNNWESLEYPIIIAVSFIPPRQVELGKRIVIKGTDRKDLNKQYMAEVIISAEGNNFFLNSIESKSYASHRNDKVLKLAHPTYNANFVFFRIMK